MSYCAQIDSESIVTEVIVGDSAWATENLGGTWVDVVEATDGYEYIDDTVDPPVIVVVPAVPGTGYPGIGWEWTGTVFRSPQPGPDCVWDDETNVWVCPEPEPL